MADSQIMESVYAVFGFSWFEAAFLLCFLFGFVFVRLDVLSTKGKKLADTAVRPSKVADSKLKRAVDSQAGSLEILAAWKACCDSTPTPPELLKAVVQALLECEPEQLADQISSHLDSHPVMRSVRTANLVLDAVARAGNIKVMEELGEAYREVLRIKPNEQTFEVMLGGYATAGDEKRVSEVYAEAALKQMRLSPRGFALAIKGFLKNGKIDATIKQFQEMSKSGFRLPPFAVTQLMRVANEAGRSKEVYEQIASLAPLEAEAVVVLLEGCLKGQDLTWAKAIEAEARAAGVPFTIAMYDPLLKLYAGGGDPGAARLFDEMQKSDVRVSEGLCVALLARCAEAKFLRFAEEIVRYVRATSKMTLAMYSALMKVYAFCNMYGKACDLYDMLTSEGLEPDAMMCGCLMRFAVECGRTDLSRKIAELAPSMEIQNYMSLIRAAGRDRDVNRAFQVLERLKASNVPADAAVHNCVLDVCVSVGQMQRARDLVTEMRQLGHVDVITFNTLIKGYCQEGDLPAAKACMGSMVEAGIPPNDISFNCLLNAIVRSRTGGDFKEAWAVIGQMKQSGVAVDRYTLSIMMKALKRVSNPRDVARCLELIDQSKVDVCSDEILLNSVLETCIRHQEHRRLESIVTRISQSNLRLSVSTYGSLIKSCSALKNLPQCWAHWNAMEARGLEPTAIVVGCMLDALVCNGEVDTAVTFLNDWKKRGQVNAIMYSTVIKGFAGSGQHARAMAMLRDIRDERVSLTVAVYNSVIDAQARSGAVHEIAEVLEMMEADKVVPDAISWATIVKGYCKNGDLDKAFEIFRSQVKKAQAANDSIIYNNMLEGCIQHARFDAADRLVEEMEASEVVPSSYTFGVLVKLYSRRRQIHRAFEVIERWSKKFKVAPNNQVRTCLMCACLHGGASADTARALRVFDELRASPAGADAKAYSSLIGGLVRHRQLTQAVTLVEEAYGLEGRHRIPKGQTLETAAMEQLMTALCRQGQAASVAVPLMRRLQSAGVTISSSVVSTVLGGSGSDSGAKGRRS